MNWLNNRFGLVFSMILLTSSLPMAGSRMRHHVSLVLIISSNWTMQGWSVSSSRRTSFMTLLTEPGSMATCLWSSLRIPRNTVPQAPLPSSIDTQYLRQSVVGCIFAQSLLLFM